MDRDSSEQNVSEPKNTELNSIKETAPTLRRLSPETRDKGRKYNVRRWIVNLALAGIFAFIAKEGFDAVVKNVDLSKYAPGISELLRQFTEDTSDILTTPTADQEFVETAQALATATELARRTPTPTSATPSLTPTPDFTATPSPTATKTDIEQIMATPTPTFTIAKDTQAPTISNGTNTEQPEQLAGNEDLPPSEVIQEEMPKISSARYAFMEQKNGRIIFYLTCDENKSDDCKYFPVRIKGKDPTSLLAVGEKGKWGEYGSGYRFVFETISIDTGDRILLETELWLVNLATDTWSFPESFFGTDINQEVFYTDVGEPGRKLHHQLPTKVTYRGGRNDTSPTK